MPSTGTVPKWREVWVDTGRGELQKQSTSDWVREPWTWTISAPNHVEPNFESTIIPSPLPPFLLLIIITFICIISFYFNFNSNLFYFFFFVLFLLYIIFTQVIITCQIHPPSVAVIKSSHSCSSFSFAADDEDLCGQNALLITSFCYTWIAQIPQRKHQ